jgi:hypothetical protein
LRVITVVAAIWFPEVALLTPDNVEDLNPAADLLREVRHEHGYAIQA